MTEKSWFQRAADFQFLVDSGLLFEINRSILNPVGLALTLKKTPEAKLVLSENLKDCRENPEAALLDVASFENGKRKLQEFLVAFGHKQMDTRRDRLGFSVQEYSSWALRKAKRG